MGPSGLCGRGLRTVLTVSCPDNVGLFVSESSRRTVLKAGRQQATTKRDAGLISSCRFTTKIYIYNIKSKYQYNTRKRANLISLKVNSTFCKTFCCLFVSLIVVLFCTPRCNRYVCVRLIPSNSLREKLKFLILYINLQSVSISLSDARSPIHEQRA